MIITDEKVSTPHNELSGHEFDAESILVQSAINLGHDTEAEHESDDWGPPPPYTQGTGIPFGHNEYAIASGNIDTPVIRPPESLIPAPSHKKDMESIRSTISSAMTLALLFLPLFLFVIEVRMLYGEISASNNMPMTSSGVIFGPILLQPPFQVDRRLPYVNGENEDRFSYSGFDGSDDDVKLFQRWRQRQWQRQAKCTGSAHDDNPQGVCHNSHHKLLFDADELYGSCSLDEKPSRRRWRHSGSKGNKFRRKTDHF